MADRAVLSLRSVSYKVGGCCVLDRVDWDVARGEHWAVLGPNGAGKTTLLRVACGDLWPNAGGQVWRDGSRLTDLRALRRRIGWITSALVARIPPRERALDTVVSGRFAQVGLKPMAWDPPTVDDRALAGELLAELGATALVGRLFGTLSQGEQQKVLIARALMVRPLLVILDDPYASLDPPSREGLLETLERLAVRPAAPSLVLVTHHIEQIGPSFARTLALRDGRVVASGPTDEVLQGEVLEALYGRAPRQIVTCGQRRWPIWAG